MTDANSSGLRQGATRAERIAAQLNDAFAPLDLEILDESGRHAGHAGARPEGETHFRVRMRSAAFRGMQRVARHRAVSTALESEFANGLHALALELKAPEEA